MMHPMNRRELLALIGAGAAVAALPVALAAAPRMSQWWLCTKTGIVNCGATQYAADNYWSEHIEGWAERGDLIRFDPDEPFTCNGCTGRLVLLQLEVERVGDELRWRPHYDPKLCWRWRPAPVRNYENELLPKESHWQLSV
jgi:hypothetical protein